MLKKVSWAGAGLLMLALGACAGMEEEAADASSVATGNSSVAATAGSSSPAAAGGSADGSAIVSADRSVIVSADGSVIVSVDGSVSVPEGGSAVVPAGGSAIVPAGGSVVVTADGSVIVSADGAENVPTGGSEIVPADGAVNVPAGESVNVPAGESVIVPAGGSVVVTADGSVIVTAGSESALVASGSGAATRVVLPANPEATGEYFDEQVGDRVFFAFDSHDLDEEARLVLARQAAWLELYPSARILIEGHCDERGTREYNFALGSRRATAVRDYLVWFGVSEDRIEYTSYGKEQPVALCAAESCWSQNRRAVSVLRDLQGS